MQLAPGEKFAIVRQLGDPTDTGTYYVQAIVRNAHTDDLLDTVNLTDRGSRRFSALWNVYSKKNDGFYISITTTVYTDSGYTTKSDMYTEESETYLIERRDYHAGFSDGGGGISAKKISNILEEALGRHIGGLNSSEEETVPVDPPEVYDDSELVAAVNSLADKFTELTLAVKAIEIKPEVTVSGPELAPVIDAVMLNGEVVAKALKEGVAGITGAVDKATTDHGVAIENLQKMVAQGHLPEFVKEFIRKLVPPGSLIDFVKQLEGAVVEENKPIPTYQEVIKSLRKKS